MSLNPETRTECVEVIANIGEKASWRDHCREIGIPVSTWLRGLGNTEVQRHGKPPAPPKESRACRGGGKIASRASGGIASRVNFATFAGAMRPTRV